MSHLSDQNWALSLITFLPLAGAAVMMIIPKAEERLHKTVALATAVATMGIGIVIAVTFDYDRTKDLQFYADTAWIKVLHARYIIGIDGISLPLLLFLINMLMIIKHCRKAS